MPVVMPLPGPEPFSIAPALSAFAQGQATKVALEDRVREREQQAQDAIIRAAQLADTPEKWDRFITTIQGQFPDADLSEFTDFSSRDAAIAQSMDPYQRASLDLQERDLAFRQQQASAPAAYTPRTPAGDVISDWQNGLFGDPASPESMRMRDALLGPIVAGEQEGQFTPLTTPEQRAQYGIDPSDPNFYQVGPDGRVYSVSGGGTTVNVNTGPTGIDYGDPPTDHVWQRDQQGAVVLDDRGAPIALPVGPALAEQQAAEAAADVAREGELVQANIVLEDIDRALGMANIWTTGFAGQLLDAIPGTPAHNLSQLVNTIKANVGFNQLQQMRDASPTGGALGQVSEQENRLLQSVLGALETSQSEPQFRSNLERLKGVYLDIVHGPGNWSFDAQGGVVIGEPTGLGPPGAPPENAEILYNQTDPNAPGIWYDEEMRQWRPVQ